LPSFADYSSVMDFTQRSQYHHVTEVVLLRLKDEGRINIPTPKNCGGQIDKCVFFRSKVLCSFFIFHFRKLATGRVRTITPIVIDAELL